MLHPVFVIIFVQELYQGSSELNFLFKVVFIAFISIKTCLFLSAHQIKKLR